MLAISPPLFGWSLEDMMRNGQNMSILEETETSDSHPHSPSFDKQQVRHDDFTHFSPANDEDKTVKKLNHNASERDRRKRINGLYSSLRSLLPQADQMKKLSIPATVSCVLKYIPQLQKELESLQEKKEGLLKKIAKQQNSCYLEKQRKDYSIRSSSVVSATRLGNNEIMIQISSMKVNKGSFVHVLSNLEQDGFILQESSSFESFDDRVFYNLHLQVQETQVTQVTTDLEDLKEKLSNLLCENKEPFHLNFGSSDIVGFL